MKRRIYLDYASAAPVSREALTAFTKAVSAYGNPSAPHTEGREAKDILEAARLDIARMIEVKPEAVIFTSGATEANALAIQGAVKGSGRENPHLLYCPTSHSSVLENLQALPIEAEAITFDALGRIDLKAFEEQLRPDTLLVSVPAVESETGTRYDTRELRRVLDRKAPGTLLHVDASQLPSVAPIERMRLGADLITLDSQKVGGVRGIGCLVAPRHIPLSPLLYGGGQERGLRSGSEPSALAASFAAALKERDVARESFVARAERMRFTFLDSLSCVKDMYVNGVDQVPSVVNLSFVRRDTDYLAALLDEAGFAVSTRSACETDEEGSRVVLLMTGDEARALSTLRISWGPGTKERELEELAKALKAELRFLDESHIHSE